MKIYVLIFGIITVGIVNAQEDPYYWYSGKKKHMEYFTEMEFLLLDQSVTVNTLKSLLENQGLKEIEKLSEKTFHNTLNNEDKTVRWAIISKSNFERLRVDTCSSILYNTAFLKTHSGEIIGLSNLFYVKLKRIEDFPKLKNFAEEQKVSILSQNKSMPRWYTLACSKFSRGNSLDMANHFMESGLFMYSQPDLLVDNVLEGANDPYFNDQWGLLNTGQHGGTAGIDINIGDAWEISAGDTSITVAVLDSGIEPDHPDLNNISNFSYDTESASTPADIYDPHGTAVAGIIGADKDNSIGIAGVAPNTLLMSVSNNLSGYTYADIERWAIGIEWAVNHGADVLNNSWGSNNLEHDLIDDAINYALTNGRNGLGCVVVFASGNDNTFVQYPANSNIDIISVGAINPWGQRKSPTSSDTETGWGSNYASLLDVVAPGVLVPTLDRQGASFGYNSGYLIHPVAGGTLLSDDYPNYDYTRWFNGTSAACPHVAGVAALILSVNSGLRQDTVRNIILRTANKLNGYNFSLYPGRSYTWNQEVGYGLIDAHAAMLDALCKHTITNTIYTSDIKISECSTVELENVKVQNNAELRIENVETLNINGPFEAEAGTGIIFTP